MSPKVEDYSDTIELSADCLDALLAMVEVFEAELFDFDRFFNCPI
jgi:hypothetical protein